MIIKFDPIYDSAGNYSENGIHYITTYEQIIWRNDG